MQRVLIRGFVRKNQVHAECALQVQRAYYLAFYLAFSFPPSHVVLMVIQKKSVDSTT
jgi:hypothetical protein